MWISLKNCLIIILLNGSAAMTTIFYSLVYCCILILLLGIAGWYKIEIAVTRKHFNSIWQIRVFQMELFSEELLLSVAAKKSCLLDNQVNWAADLSTHRKWMTIWCCKYRLFILSKYWILYKYKCFALNV